MLLQISIMCHRSAFPVLAVAILGVKLMMLHTIAVASIALFTFYTFCVIFVTRKTYFGGPVKGCKPICMHVND